MEKCVSPPKTSIQLLVSCGEAHYSKICSTKSGPFLNLKYQSLFPMFKLKSSSVTHLKRYLAVFYVITWTQSFWPVYSAFGSKFGILPNLLNFKYLKNFYKASVKSYSFSKEKCIILQLWTSKNWFLISRCSFSFYFVQGYRHLYMHIPTWIRWTNFSFTFFYLLFYDIFSRDDGL